MDDENALFNIEISDISDDEPSKKDACRTGQTEEAFQAIRREYRPKVEDGNIVKAVKLPLPAGAPKPRVHEVIHAAEELYFFRQYEDAIKFIQDVLSGSDGLDSETRQLLLKYEQRCQQKLNSTTSA